MTKDVSNKISNIVKSRLAKKSQAESEQILSGRDVQETEFRSGVEEDDYDVGMGKSIADNTDAMEMLHFSNVEVNSMATSGIDANNNNSRFIEIKFYNIVSIVFSLISSISLILGLAFQLKKQQSDYAILLATGVQISLVYCMYESLRRKIILKLSKLDSNELKIKAIEGSKSNSTYSESLQSLLDRNGIQEDADVVNNLTSALPDISAGHLPGYKRIFFIFTALTVIGILSIFVL
jgi:hypothetical protein